MSDLNDIKDAANTAAADSGDLIVAAMLRGVETWAGAQREMLAGVEAMWAEWTRQQRQAAEFSARTVQQMCDCRTPRDFAQLQQQWLAGSLERAVSSIDSVAGHAVQPTTPYDLAMACAAAQ